MNEELFPSGYTHLEGYSVESSSIANNFIICADRLFRFYHKPWAKLNIRMQCVRAMNCSVDHIRRPNLLFS